jgi:hypothetical protein
LRDLPDLERLEGAGLLERAGSDDERGIERNMGGG